jgi:hypothetical protein
MSAETDPNNPTSRSLTALLGDEVDRLRLLKRRTDPRAHAELARRIERAIQAAECPTCAESQPDGVPCATPARSCDACATALEWVRAQRLEIEELTRRRGDAADDEEI